jgi:hypothetical protein
MNWNSRPRPGVQASLRTSVNFQLRLVKQRR